MEKNSNQILLLGEKLMVRFGYDPTLLAVVSQFPGRKFHNSKYPEKRHWSIPLVQIENLVQTLLPYGFTVNKEAKELYKATKRLKKKIKIIKNGDFNSLELAAFLSLYVPFYDYQKIGVGFICVGKNVLLADQPGLGKTVQSLSATKIRNAQKVLIFCPLSAKTTWKEEIEKWLGKEEVIMIGGSPKERAVQWKTPAKYYISNYHLLLKDLALMQDIPWDFIVADEATDISNPTAKRTIEIKKLKSKYKVALTGTPISNTAEDLWSIMDWLQPGLLGSHYEFIREYCITDDYGQVVSYKNLHKLREVVEPFFLRRLKSEVLTELPPKTYINIYTEFNPTERRLYDAIQKNLKKELQEIGMNNSKNLANGYVKLARLKQMTCSTELITGENISSKLDDLKELLTIILANNEKAIIFSQFKPMVRIMERELAKYNPLIITGDVDEDQRTINRKLFMEQDKYKLLIMTSAGHRALNLQRATYIIHYDLPWSISALEQREDRAHRSGQKLPVTVYKMMVKNSIDEVINYKVLSPKSDIANTVLGDNATVS